MPGALSSLETKTTVRYAEFSRVQLNSQRATGVDGLQARFAVHVQHSACVQDGDSTMEEGRLA